MSWLTILSIWLMVGGVVAVAFGLFVRDRSEDE